MLSSDVSGQQWKGPSSSNTEGPIVRFSTGAQRSAIVAGQKTKPVRFDLISPIALRRLAEVYAEGASKYGDNNWLKGMPNGELLNRAIAHLNEWNAGNEDEDHLGHALWNVAALVHFSEKGGTDASVGGVPSDRAGDLYPRRNCLGPVDPARIEPIPNVGLDFTR